MSDEEKLQKYLPLIRSAAGWTAEELGNKIGVTKQTISNLENQKTKMSKTQYLAIQMVISQRIATSLDDPTLSNIMKLMMNTDEEQPINYDAIPQAMAVVEDIEKEMPTTTSEIYDHSKKGIIGTTVGAAGAIGSAIAMLGLGPASAISAAVLGATIAPWLTKALNEDEEERDGH